MRVGSNRPAALAPRSASSSLQSPQGPIPGRSVKTFEQSQMASSNLNMDGIMLFEQPFVRVSAETPVLWHAVKCELDHA